MKKKIELTAGDVKKHVNGQLSGYPWGGDCFEVHQNQWGEWIANCHIWGYYGRDPEDPNWRYYPKDDPECPVQQFMVAFHQFSGDDIYSVLHEAENDKRKPNTTEMLGDIDPFMPPSPYIVEPIKEYLKNHKDHLIPF